MIDLNALIVEARKQEQVKEEAARAAREAAEAEIRADAISQFIELLIGEIGADVLDALHPIYEARLHQKLASVTAQWHDDDSATDWTLGTRTDKLFVLKAATKQKNTMLNWDDIRAGTLRERLLLGIGYAREYVTRERERVRAAIIERERQKDEAERDRLLREQEETKLLAAADEVHAEIEALIARRTAEEEAKLWQWRSGATITLYMVKYCTGTRYVEEEGSEFDYATGWTQTDCFNEDGYITLMSRSKPRHLRLDIYTHMPIWERYTFSSIDELPAALRENSGFIIRGITKRCFTDGHWRWVYDDSEAWGCTAAPDGLPVAWVRELIDAAQ